MFYVVLGAIIVAIAALVLYLVTGYVGTNFVVGNHVEWRRHVSEPSDFGLNAEEVSFSSEDGILLRAWWFSTETPPAVTILAHGSGGNRSHSLSRAAFLVRNGYSVLALDLRGHGESQGKYMTPGYLEALDIVGAVAFLRRRGYTGLVIVFGYSYGAVASIHAAAKSDDIAAVIADSAFISNADMMKRARKSVMKDKNIPRFLRVGFQLTRLPFMQQVMKLFFYIRTGVMIDNSRADALPAIPDLGSKPILFLTGEYDSIAPPENTRLMYEAAKSPGKSVVVVAGATHSTYRPGLRSYEETVLKFINGIT